LNIGRYRLIANSAEFEAQVLKITIRYRAFEEFFDRWLKIGRERIHASGGTSAGRILRRKGSE
jgi:hypothetical protein